jgi:hypothetical protein
MQDETPGDLLRGSFVAYVKGLANGVGVEVSPHHPAVRIPCPSVYPVIGSLALMLRTSPVVRVLALPFKAALRLLCHR